MVNINKPIETMSRASLELLANRQQDEIDAWQSLDGINWYEKSKEQQATIDRLLAALVRLEAAADVYAADQAGAVDPRCGLVQPIDVADGIELNEAIKQAREALGQTDD